MKAQDFFKVSVTIDADRPVNIVCDFGQYLFFDSSNQIEMEESLFDLKECFRVVKNPKMMTIDFVQGNLSYSHFKTIKSFRMIKNYDDSWKVSRSETGTFTDWFETSEEYKSYFRKELQQFIRNANYQFVEELKKALNAA